MTMSEYEQLIARHLDGETSPAEDSRLQTLLSENADVQTAFDEAQALRDLIQGDRAQLPRSSPHTADRIMKRLNEDKAASVIKPSRHSFGRALAVAAALVLLIGGAFWAGRSTVEAQTSDASESISQELDDLEAMGIDRSKAQAAFETYKRRIRDLEEQTSRTTAELYRELESTLEDLKKHAAKRR